MEKKVPTKVTREMLEWFGDGEMDVELMIQLGVLKEKIILWYWINDPESPYNLNRNQDQDKESK